jgi:sugar lactone lactonase YvrE
MQMGAAYYAANADPWTDPDLANASYDSVNFSVSSQDTTPTGLYFKTDGTAFYVSGRGNWPNAAVYQYSLSTAWDISTASYANKTFNVGSQSTFAECIQFKSDGTTFYIIDKDVDKIFQYSLSTAWDVSTASYASKSLAVNTQEVFPTAMFFKSDGTKVYITGSMTDTIYQYSLSTAWDVSTGSYESKSFSVSSQLSIPEAMFFNPNGDKVWVIGSSNRRVYQYSLSTAWDISTASYDSISFLTHSQDTEPYGLAFKNDGSKMYTVGAANDKVYQFST